MMSCSNSNKGVQIFKSTLVSVFCIFSFLTLFTTLSMAETTLLQDDFEDGNASDWGLDEGFAVTDDNGNFTLTGSGHIQAYYNEINWPLISLFQADIKLAGENPAVHLNLWADCERYAVGISREGLYLFKDSPCDVTTEIGSTQTPLSLDTWYTIRLVCDAAGNVEVYVDDVLQMDHSDSQPLDYSSISIEMLNDDDVFVDNVIAKTQESSSSTQWESTGGPLGGLGYDIRIHPQNHDVMYVTDNYAGVLKSTDRGRMWQQQNSGISVKSGETDDAYNIFCLTIDPNDNETLWAGTFGEGTEYGVFNSRDGGSNWQAKTGGITTDGTNNIVF